MTTRKLPTAKQIAASLHDAARREVPLSSEALRIIEQLHQVRDGESVFSLKAASIDALFRKARDKAGCGRADFSRFPAFGNHAAGQAARRAAAGQDDRPSGLENVDGLLQPARGRFGWRSGIADETDQ